MKANELFEKLKTDPGFANEVADRLQAKKDEGATDVVKAAVEVAKEMGYEVEIEDVQSLQKENVEELSSDELDGVAGGYIFRTGTYETQECTDNFIFDVVDDHNGRVLASGLSREDAKNMARELGQSPEQIDEETLNKLRDMGPVQEVIRMDPAKGTVY